MSVAVGNLLLWRFFAHILIETALNLAVEHLAVFVGYFAEYLLEEGERRDEVETPIGQRGENLPKVTHQRLHLLVVQETLAIGRVGDDDAVGVAALYLAHIHTLPVDIVRDARR